MNRLTTEDSDPSVSISVDLHGYSTRSAARIVSAFVDVAWQRGLAEVYFIHGAPDVSMSEARLGGRGAIKYFVRRLVRSGELSRWCYDIRDKSQVERMQSEFDEDGKKRALNFDAEDDVAFEYCVCIRDNPEPNLRRWPRLPPEDYDRDKWY